MLYTCSACWCNFGCQCNHLTLVDGLTVNMDFLLRAGACTLHIIMVRLQLRKQLTSAIHGKRNLEP